MLFSFLVSTALVLGQADASNKATLQPPVVPAAAGTNQPDPKTPPAKPGEPADANSYRVYDAGRPGFAHRLVKAYCDEFKPKEDTGNGEDPPRRAMPSPFAFLPLNIKASR